MSRFSLAELLPLRDREVEYKAIYLSGELPGDPLGMEKEATAYKEAFDARYSRGLYPVFSPEMPPPVLAYEGSLRINGYPEELPLCLFQHGRYFPGFLHKHDYYELVCVVNGSCHHTIGSDRSILMTGDVAVIPPDTAHNIQAFDDSGLVFILSVRADVFEKHMPDLLHGKHPLMEILRLGRENLSRGCYIVFHCGEYLREDNLLAAIWEEQHCDEPYTEAINLAQLHAFLLHLIRHFGNNTIFCAQKADDFSSQLLQYIRNHFHTVTLKDLAEQFHYSERQLQRVIQKSVGCSFSELTAQLRIEYVAEQLRKTNASVAQIAKWAGIESVSHLYRKFVTRYGVTPAEYRTTIRNGE